MLEAAAPPIARHKDQLQQRPTAAATDRPTDTSKK